MKKAGVQAYLVPSTDPHQSEYVPECWQRRQWISGFTGSAGEIVVTAGKAALWTDGRYFLQAGEQLAGSGIDLMKIGIAGTPSISAWLQASLRKGAKVGVDPAVMSHDRFRQFSHELAERDLVLVSVRKNLIDPLWKDQPVIPVDPVLIHPVKFTGESYPSKLKKLRKAMAEYGAKAHIITALDCIAWLFNIRGTDVQYNPVAVSYAIITDKTATLFVNPKKVTPKLKQSFGKQVRIEPYQTFGPALRKLASRNHKVWIDGATVNQWVVDTLGKKTDILVRESPIPLMKACKNAVEIEGARQAHIRDGAAMVRFLHWLEKTVPTGTVTEISAAEQLDAFRAEQFGYRGSSFETIAGYAGHGAIVHYAATPETNSRLKPRGLFLIDSGGQYPDGTTDITRTVCFAKPTPEQKDRFTRVLKGNLSLERLRFPAGTTGPMLDTIARKALWDIGLNYNHGTGHGIGSFLNVHEGPHRVAPSGGFFVPLRPGMIFSNEPGYYCAGRYGIRIENLVYVTEDKKLSRHGTPFNKLECLTLAPIDTRLIDRRLLSPDERQHLNEYHARVRRILKRYLNKDDAAWLEKATRPI